MGSALTGAYRWSRANLFSSPLNALLTVAATYLLTRTLPALVNWAILHASIAAPDYAGCRAADGACWAFIVDWFRFLIFGRFPYAEQWRPALVIGIFLVMLAASVNRRWWDRRLALLWILGLGLAALLMWGGVFGMPYVETELWNGLPLTLILAVGGIGLSFPLALVLALGRRSRLPAVRFLSVAYIEIIRGMPFIVFLFMTSVMLPLFLPSAIDIDTWLFGHLHIDIVIPKLWRALVAFTLFLAAYVAEVIRGGLQAVPRGQYEAAQSLGLGYWRQMRLVILPQALTVSIPALVGNFIGGFKDTALVTVIGFFDLLQDATTAINDPHWRGAYVEAYAFVAAIYFGFCYLMSRYSRYLEAELRRGA